MKANIITVVNKKGGVGKTATAQAIGTGTAHAGYKTLLIDLDSQRDLTSYFYVSKQEMDQIDYTSFELLTKYAEPAQTIKHTEFEKLDLIPASKSLAFIDKELNAPVGNEERLREALEPICNDYDFIAIDTPRIMDLCTTNALVACDNVILTAEADEASIDAIEDTLQMILTIKKYRNNKLNVLGVLITRYKNTSIHKRNLEIIKDIANSCGINVFNTPIREGTVLQEVRSMKASLYAYAPKSHICEDYTALVNEITNLISNVIK